MGPGIGHAAGDCRADSRSRDPWDPGYGVWRSGYCKLMVNQSGHVGGHVQVHWEVDVHAWAF